MIVNKKIQGEVLKLFGFKGKPGTTTSVSSKPNTCKGMRLENTILRLLFDQLRSFYVASIIFEDELYFLQSWNWWVEQTNAKENDIRRRPAPCI